MNEPATGQSWLALSFGSLELCMNDLRLPARKRVHVASWASR